MAEVRRYIGVDPASADRPDSLVLVEERVLRRVCWRERADFSGQYLAAESYDVLALLDPASDRMRVNVTAGVYADPQTELVHEYFDVRVATWFDHWKMAHPRLSRALRLAAPRFRKDRRTIAIDWRRHYPELPAPITEPERVMQVTSPRWSMAPR